MVHIMIGDFMSDKQFDAMLKEHIASLDRVARIATEPVVIKALYEERKLVISKLGYDMEENSIYDQIK